MRMRRSSRLPITEWSVTCLRSCRHWLKRSRKRKHKALMAMRVSRRCGLSIALTIFCVLASSVSCKKPVSPNVAATVNGRPISYAELDRAIAAQFPNAPPNANSDQTSGVRLEALRALIDNEIMLQRAEKEGLLASDADVDAKFNELKTPYTKEEFQKLLQQRKMSVADLKAQIRRELSVQKLRSEERRVGKEWGARGAREGPRDKRPVRRDAEARAG